MLRYRGSLCGALVLDDLRDGAHGAFLDAVAARNAGILVHNVSLAANNLEHFLRAGVDADATANALIGIDNRVRHIILLLVQNTREHTGNFPKNLLPARYHGSMQMQEKSAIFPGCGTNSLMDAWRAREQREGCAFACVRATTRGRAKEAELFASEAAHARQRALRTEAPFRHTAERPLQNLDPPPTSADARQLLAHEHVEDARARRTPCVGTPWGRAPGCAEATSPMIAASAP